MRFEFNSSMDMWECGAMATTNCHRVLLSPVLATLESELKKEPSDRLSSVYLLGKQTQILAYLN